MGHAADPVHAIRALVADDAAALRDHLLRLDSEGRRSRFAMAASDTFVIAYAQAAMRADAVVLGWFEGARLRAAGELRPIDSEAAEAAFSVEPGYRGRGIGSALFRLVAQEARRRDLRRLHMSCLVGNAAMQALARKFAADLVVEPATLLPDLRGEAGPSPAPLMQSHEIEEEFVTATVVLRRRWFGFSRRRT